MYKPQRVTKKALHSSKCKDLSSCDWSTGWKDGEGKDFINLCNILVVNLLIYNQAIGVFENMKYLMKWTFQKLFKDNYSSESTHNSFSKYPLNSWYPYIALASRVSWHHWDTQTPQITPQETHNFMWEIYKNVNFKQILFTSIWLLRHCIRIICLFSISKYMFVVVIWIDCHHPWKIGCHKN